MFLPIQLRFSFNTPFLVAGACLSFLLSGHGVAAQSVLPEKLTTTLQKAGVPVSGIGIVVMPVSANDATAATLTYNADLPLHPASTMKLLTTMVALDELGPNFRWKTQLLSDQPIVSDVLNGNLYLRGGGDPDLNLQKLGVLLRDLRNLGLRSIEGNIVLDRSYFQPERSDMSVPAFDAYPNAYYNVIPDALLINSNISSIAVQSDDDHVRVNLLTPLNKVRIDSQLSMIKKPCTEWEKYWQAPTLMSNGDDITVSLNGNFPRNCKITQHLNLLDRNQYIGHAIRQLWQEMGGTWQGTMVDGKAPATAQQLLEHQSETLADTIRIVNKHSDNAMARSIFLTLGAESALGINGDSNNSAQRAEARVRSWLFKHGINDTNLVLENGSGLSRIEQISARQMAALLLAASRSNWYPEFASSLPIAGMDGTMRKRLRESPAALSSRIKTGTLKDSVAIAGYVCDVQKQQWIVVAMVNSDKADKARTALDILIDWVATGGDVSASNAPALSSVQPIAHGQESH